jgi:hypothetical protein
MSSCLATTFTSSETPPSGGSVSLVAGAGVSVTAGVGGSAATGVGVSCAVAVLAVRSAAANDRIVETHRVSAHIGFVIEVLALKPRRSAAATLGQVDETDLMREEEPGNERVRRTERGPKLRQPPGDTAAQERTPVPLQNQPG